MVTLAELEFSSRLNPSDGIKSNQFSIFFSTESEKAELFKEDHIDDWTDLPVAHFSFALKRIFSYKAIQSAETWMAKSTQMVADIRSPSGIRKEAVGAIAEGFYVPGLSMQLTRNQESPCETVILTCLCINESMSVYPKQHKFLKPSDVFYETELVHPGFLQIVARYPGWGGATAFIPTASYKTPLLTERDKSNYHSEYGSVLYVREPKMAFPCPVWPSVAEGWRNRRRPVNWPKKPIVDSIVSDGCHVTPIAHKNSPNEGVEWQFLFSIAERTLALEALSKHQKYCYILFKAICSQYLKHLEYITSGHTKSIFFYTCELLPESLWSANPGGCVLYLMDQLFVQVQEHNIPNYFIPTNNMIDHFTEEMYSELQSSLMTFRTQPLSAIQQLALNNHITCAQTVIEKILDDVPFFRNHRSVRESTLSVFLPQTISQIQSLVYGWKIRDALELASEAYEERLSVSTCSDSIPYHIFLSQVLMNMSTQAQWWFCYYADNHFNLSMVKELRSSHSMVTFGEVFGTDVAGTHSDLLVPISLVTNVFKFVNDFARDLTKNGKHSRTLPYLHFCLKKYKEIKFETNIPPESEPGYENEYDLTRNQMLEIYWNLYTVYKAKDQMAFFQDLMPDIQDLCGSINTESSSSYLSRFLDAIEDFQNSQSQYGEKRKVTSM